MSGGTTATAAVNQVQLARQRQTNKIRVYTFGDNIQAEQAGSFDSPFSPLNLAWL